MRCWWILQIAQVALPCPPFPQQIGRCQLQVSKQPNAKVAAANTSLSVNADVWSMCKTFISFSAELTM